MQQAPLPLALSLAALLLGGCGNDDSTSTGPADAASALDADAPNDVPDAAWSFYACTTPDQCYFGSGLGEPANTSCGFADGGSSPALSVCPADGLVGCCVVGDADVAGSGTCLYPPTTLAEVQAYCTQQRLTFTPMMPAMPSMP